MLFAPLVAIMLHNIVTFDFFSLVALIRDLAPFSLFVDLQLVYYLLLNE